MMIEPVVEILAILILVAIVVVLIISLAVGAVLGVISLRVLRRVDMFLKHVGEIQKKVGRCLDD